MKHDHLYQKYHKSMLQFIDPLIFLNDSINFYLLRLLQKSKYTILSNY